MIWSITQHGFQMILLFINYCTLTRHSAFPTVHCGIRQLDFPFPPKKNQAFYGSPLSPCMQDVHSDDCSGSSFSRMCPECRVVYRTEFHFMNHVCRKVNNHVYTSTFTCKIVIAHSLSRFLFVCFFLS